MNGISPARPLPAQFPTPPAVTGIRAENVTTNAYQTRSTLMWKPPADYDHVVVDMVRSIDRTRIPSLVGAPGYQFLDTSAGGVYVGEVEQQTQTYRFVTRGQEGRLGKPSFYTVYGSVLQVADRPGLVPYGQSTTLTGRLTQRWGGDDPREATEPYGGPPLAGQLVLLCEQRYGAYVPGRCTEVDRARTNSRGGFTVTATPRENSVYDVVLPPTDSILANETRALNAFVAPRTDLRVRKTHRARSGTAVRRGSVVQFSTSRARAGSRGVVMLQRFDGRTWRTVVTKQLPRGAGSRVVLKYREKKGGPHSYRVLKPGDSRHVHGYSRIVRLRFR